MAKYGIASSITRFPLGSKASHRTGQHLWDDHTGRIALGWRMNGRRPCRSCLADITACAVIVFIVSGTLRSPLA